MTLQAKYNPDQPKRCIFRDVFNSEQETIKIGGNPNRNLWETIGEGELVTYTEPAEWTHNKYIIPSFGQRNQSAEYYSGVHKRLYFLLSTTDANGSGGYKYYMDYYDYDSETFSGAPVEVPLATNLTDSTHLQPTMTITRGGYILVTINLNHNGDIVIYKSDNSEDISAWTKKFDSSTVPGMAAGNCYPSIVKCKDKIICNCRGDADNYQRHTIVSSDEGENWDDYDLLTMEDTDFWVYGKFMSCDPELGAFLLLDLNNNKLQGGNGCGAYATAQNHPKAALLWTDDGVTWGNMEYYTSGKSGGYSKNIDTGGEINNSLDELYDNFMVINDPWWIDDGTANGEYPNNFVFDGAVMGNGNVMILGGHGERDLCHGVGGWDNYVKHVRTYLYNSTENTWDYHDVPRGEFSVDFSNPRFLMPDGWTENEAVMICKQSDGSNNQFYRYTTTDAGASWTGAEKITNFTSAAGMRNYSHGFWGTNPGRVYFFSNSDGSEIELWRLDKQWKPTAEGIKNVVFNDGKLEVPNDLGWISYDNVLIPKETPFTLRVKFKTHETFEDDTRYILDNRNIYGDCYIYVSGATKKIMGSGFVAGWKFSVNGEGDYDSGNGPDILSETSYEVVFRVNNGADSDITGLFLFRNSDGGYNFDSNIEFVEIYNYAWTAEEVKNAYNNKRFRKPALNQEGSSASLMDEGKGTFDDGTIESWVAYGNNTIENDNGALKITYVDDEHGALVSLREAADLNTNLTVGETYRIRARAKRNAGNQKLRLNLGNPYPYLPDLTTEYTWVELIFVATHASNNSLYCGSMSAGEIIWIDQWYIQEYTALSEILHVSSRGGSIIDRMGNTLTNTDVTVFRDGGVKAMKFNGDTSKVDCGEPDDLTGSKTFLVWIKSYSFGGGDQGRIIDNGKFLIRHGSLNKLYITNDGSTYRYSAVNLIELHKWILLVIIRKPDGTVSIYKNGSVFTGSTGSDGTPVAGTTNIILGNDNAGSFGFDGLMSGICIVDGLLSAEQISQYYTATRKKYRA